MKKPSFFERLAGNLRFDDDEVEVKPQVKEERKTLPPRQREINVSNEFSAEKPAPVATTEEVGELPVDVYETPNEIIIQTLIAGVLPENLAINITRDVVSISGKREETKGVPNQLSYTGVVLGIIERIVNLPEEIEIDSAEAIERHGMLIIKLPKIDKRRKTMLKIKSI